MLDSSRPAGASTRCHAFSVCLVGHHSAGLCSDDLLGVGHQCRVLRRVVLGDRLLRSRFGISIWCCFAISLSLFSLDLLSFCGSIYAVLLTCLAFATAPTMLWAFFITETYSEVLVIAAASLVPSFRAVRTDPLRVLRAE